MPTQKRVLKDLNDTNDNLTQLQMNIQPSSTNNDAQLFIKMFMAQHKFPDQLQKMANTPHTKKTSLTKDPKLQEMFSSVKSLEKIEEQITTIHRRLPNIKSLPLLQSSQSSSS